MENIIHHLAKQMSYVFVLYGESTEENRDIYTYVCEAIISTLFNILLCLITAFILGSIFDGFIFLLVFAIIRRYAGGYHAKTHFKCITICNFITAVGVIFVQQIELLHTMPVYLMLSAISILGITIFSPVENENKSSGAEYLAKRKIKSIRISLVIFFIGILDFILLDMSISAIISVSKFFVLIGMLCGLYSNIHMDKMRA